MVESEFPSFKADPGEMHTLWRMCLYGNYRWLNVRPVHYFSTCLKVTELRNAPSLLLMSDIPQAERWGFNALFQRTINAARIDGIVSQYLEQQDKLKYFPPITIVLLPSDGEKLLRKYSQNEFSVRREKGNTHWTLDGIEVEFSGPPEPGTVARLRWDVSKQWAVVVDGQHRVQALRDYLRGPARQQDMKKEVPATIVVFDPEFPAGKDVLHLTREMFIDVNSRAERVDKSRLILLDDRDVCALITRRLLWEAIEDDNGNLPIPSGDHIGSIRALPAIPQELVDLYADRQKADMNKNEPWQYTSVYTLWRTIRDFVFEDNWDTFELILEVGSGVGSTSVEKTLKERRDFWEKEEEEEAEVSGISDEDIFAFNPREAEILATSFMNRYGHLLRAVFTGLTPYADFLETALVAFNSPDGNDLRSFLIAAGRSDDDRTGASKGSEVVVDSDDPERQDRVLKLATTIRKPEGWDKELPWWSVFQRAVVFAPLDIQSALETAMGPIDSQKDLADAYVQALNALYAQGFFARAAAVATPPAKGEEWQPPTTHIWAGLFEKWGETLDYSDGAAKRGAALIRLCVSAYHARERDQTLDDFVTSIESSKPQKKSYTAVTNAYRKVFKKKDDLSERPGPADEAEYGRAANARFRDVLQAFVFGSTAKASTGKRGKEKKG